MFGVRRALMPTNHALHRDGRRGSPAFPDRLNSPHHPPRTAFGTCRSSGPYDESGVPRAARATAKLSSSIRKRVI